MIRAILVAAGLTWWKRQRRNTSRTRAMIHNETTAERERADLTGRRYPRHCGTCCNDWSSCNCTPQDLE